MWKITLKLHRRSFVLGTICGLASGLINTVGRLLVLGLIVHNLSNVEEMGNNAPDGLTERVVLLAFQVTTVKPKFIIVHYYGTRSGNLHLATFSPGWHLTHSDHITLSDLQLPRHLCYSGVLQLDSMSTLLVARHLTLTSASRLTSKSRRLLTPVRDELFIFE